MRVLLNKISATAMVAFLTMALAACGGEGSGDSDDSTAASNNSAGSEAATDAMEEAENAAEEARDDPDSMEDMAGQASEAIASEAREAAANVEAAAAEAADAASETASDVAGKAANLTAEATDAAASAASTVSLAGDAAAGRRVFVKCMACHTVQEGQHRVGPSLYGIIGRPAGTIEGFNYSDANKNSGIVWTEDIMFEYLENPQEYMPGTRMIFPGLPSEQDRANVIAYLKSAAE